MIQLINIKFKGKKVEFKILSRTLKDFTKKAPCFSLIQASTSPFISDSGPKADYLCFVEHDFLEDFGKYP